VNVVIAVVAAVGAVMIAVPGLPVRAVHVPVPVALIAADPPGNIAQLTVLSAPAFGFAVTDIATVSVQPDAFVHIYLYVPAAVKPVILVVGLAGAAMVAVPGLPVMAVHVPAPVAVIAAVPPGSMAQFTVLSAPAVGLAVMATDAVSLHPDALVQINLYVPAVVNPVMLVVALLAFAMLAVPGLPVIAVHVPVPVAAMAAVPPGSAAQLTAISAPAFGFAVTTTAAVSLQPDALVQINL
jgi:hypothetical protein